MAVGSFEEYFLAVNKKNGHVCVTMPFIDFEEQKTLFIWGSAQCILDAKITMYYYV